MQSSSHPRTDSLADTIRRTLRVLGAQPSHASDPSTTAGAARLVFERLRRAGVPTRWIDDGNAPLIVAGNGPTAISTYLDDAHPLSGDHSGRPLEFGAGTVRGMGIERKAGAVAAMAILLANPELSDSLTLIVETDRLAGSIALERWISEQRPAFDWVAWEVSDLPLIPPVLVRAATGVLTLEITLQSTRDRVEPVYGTVLPDLGFALASLLTSLKTPDEEVRLDGFYDSISTPDDSEYESLLAAAPEISNWLRRIARGERSLSTSHMTLGMFCAPAVVVRELLMGTLDNYLPESASALIEFQLLPGQSPEQILSEMQRLAGESPFVATVAPLLLRPPVFPSVALMPTGDLPIIPIAPGPSPATVFDQAGIPGIGYAVVGRSADREETGITLESVERGSQFLLSLTQNLSTGNSQRS